MRADPKIAFATAIALGVAPTLSTTTAALAETQQERDACM
jgi:hypothetical protein